MRIHRRGGLLVTFGLAAGGLVVATAPAVPALASGQVCAGIVIDSGPGGPATLTQGASVAPGSSDLDLLNAAGDSFKPNDSGLVCLINGYPPSGLQNCLQAAHGLFYYWSYWEGDPATNTWTYAAVGPAEHTVEAGQSYVEGWRYQDPGPASPAAAKPSVTPTAAFAQACLKVPPPTTTTTTAGASGAAGSSTTTTAAAPAHAPATAAIGSHPGTTNHRGEVRLRRQRRRPRRRVAVDKSRRKLQATWPPLRLRRPPTRDSRTRIPPTNSPSRVPLSTEVRAEMPRSQSYWWSSSRCWALRRG